MSETKFLKGECQQCGGHLEFPAEAVGATIACPHCGKQTELMLAIPKQKSAIPTKTIVFTVVAILILGGGLAGAMFALKRAQRLAAENGLVAPPKKTAPREPENPFAKDAFRASPVTIEKASGSSLVYAVGTIGNLTNRQRFAVTVELELQDASGKKIGNAKDYQRVIEPNAEWQFRALVVDGKTSAARVTAIKEQQ